MPIGQDSGFNSNTMLLAKINPPAQIVAQTTPFEHSTTDAPYMSVVANPYIPDAEVTNFTLSFGYYEPPVGSEEPQPPPYVFIYTYQLPLTKQELATWGTDDEELYEIVVNKLGCSIVEFINVDL
jgi:hypothetical protein